MESTALSVLIERALLILHVNSQRIFTVFHMTDSKPQDPEPEGGKKKEGYMKIVQSPKQHMKCKWLRMHHTNIQHLRLKYNERLFTEYLLG